MTLEVLLLILLSGVVPSDLCHEGMLKSSLWGMSLSSPTLPWCQTQCRTVRALKQRPFRGHASLAQARGCSARKRSHRRLSLVRGGKGPHCSGVPVSAEFREEWDAHLNQVFGSHLPFLAGWQQYPLLRDHRRIPLCPLPQHVQQQGASERNGLHA